MNNVPVVVVVKGVAKSFVPLLSLLLVLLVGLSANICSYKVVGITVSTLPGQVLPLLPLAYICVVIFEFNKSFWLVLLS